jgi:hypothetical protein
LAGEFLNERDDRYFRFGMKRNAPAFLFPLHVTTCDENVVNVVPVLQEIANAQREELGNPETLAVT